MHGYHLFVYLIFSFLGLGVLIQEGIKLLNTWLEGERSISFCKYIGRNTALLKPNEIPHGKDISVYMIQNGMLNST